MQLMDTNSPTEHRLNRLPQRLDYTLIPPPLGELEFVHSLFEFCLSPPILSDLSKPLVDEKAALPAIIVTPSSPSGETDFRIAFLAPEPKPSLHARLSQRLQSLTPKSRASQLKARAFLLLFLPLFILACHLLVHRLAARRPHLHFDGHMQGGGITGAGGDDISPSAGGAFWFDMNDYWGARHARNFVIVDPPTSE